MQLNKLPFALCLAASLAACVVDDGGTDTDASGTSSATDPSTTMTTDPSTTMTTDPTTTMTTDPATTDPSSSTDPATTDPSTETDPGTESGSSGVVDDTGTDTGTVGNCGWDVDGGFYACGFEGEDPDGNFDIACPEEPVAGGKCDKNTPINGIGCCFEGGNAFCGEDGTIQIDKSCAAG